MVVPMMMVVVRTALRLVRFYEPTDRNRRGQRSQNPQQNCESDNSRHGNTAETTRARKYIARRKSRLVFKSRWYCKNESWSFWLSMLCMELRFEEQKRNRSEGFQVCVWGYSERDIQSAERRVGDDRIATKHVCL